MAALAAFGLTVVTVLVFLLFNQVSGHFLEDLFFSRRPFRPAFSWVAYTVFYIWTIYAFFLAIFWLLLRGSRTLDEADANPRKLSGLLALDARVRRDYGGWPLYLAGVVGLVCLLSLRAMQLAIVQPVVWALTALIVPTLCLLWRGRAPVTAIRPAGQTRRSVTEVLLPPAPEAVIAHLKQHRQYRGQLRATMTVPSIHASDIEDINERPWGALAKPGGLLHSALVSIGVAGFHKLYPHQRDILDRLLVDPEEASQRNHVVLTTGPGSGRHLTLFLAILDRTLRRGAHVLVVTPNDETLHQEYQRFQTLADRTDWHYALYEARVVLDEIPGVEDPPPEIVFCSIDTLHRRVLRDARMWSEFFDGLELLIATDVDAYTGIYGANAAQVFRRLRLAAGSQRSVIQYVATMQPARNAESFVGSLFGTTAADDRIQVFGLDTSPRPEQVLGVWMPPLDRISSVEVAGSQRRQIRRQDPVDAAIDLAIALLEISDYRLLIYCYEWGDSIADSVSNRIDQGIGTALTEHRLRIISHETELGRIQANYDGLLVLGSPSHIDRLQRLTGTLGAARNGGLVLMLGTHTPAGMRITRSIQGAVDAQGWVASAGVDLPGIVIPANFRHLSVIRKHLRCAVSERQVRRTEIWHTYGRRGIAVADGWVQSGLATWKEVVVDPSSGQSIDQILIPGPDLSDGAWETAHLTTLSSEPDELVEVLSRSEGTPLFRVDQHRAALVLYPRKQILIGQKAMVLNRESDGGYFADLPVGLSVDESAVRPRYEMAARVAAGYQSPSESLYRISNGEPFLAARMPVEISATIAGLRLDGPDGVSVQPSPRRDTANLQVDALVIADGFEADGMSSEVAHTLAHALRVALRLALPSAMTSSDFLVVDLPGIEGFIDHPCVLISDTVGDGLGFAEALESGLQDLLRDAYRIMVSCPCQYGCSACIADRDCLSWDAEGTCDSRLSKRDALLYLGSLLGNSAVRISGMTPVQLDKVRYEAVDDPEFLTAVRERVIRFGLAPLLDAPFTPVNLASIRFLTRTERENLGAHTMGYYDVRRNEVVVTPLPEEDLVGIIAHEYAHNWQFTYDQDGQRHMHPSIEDPDIVPWNGRFLAEGFAQWAELRVLDAFGFKSNVDDIAFRFYDGYGEGFQVVKVIEDRQGVAGVIDLMASPMSQEQMRSLLAESNTLDRVLAIARLLEDGEIELPPPDIARSQSLEEQPSMEESGEY